MRIKNRYKQKRGGVRRGLKEARKRYQAPVTIIKADGTRQTVDSHVYHAISHATPEEILVHGLRQLPYEKYLETPHWRFLRRKMLKRAEHKCQRCRAGMVVLHVHHKTYERRGEERLSDLIVLCEKCHSQEHGLVN